MTNQPTEIAIVGGGMVGGALALGLAQHGFAVTVIEHAEPAPFVAASQPDVRISAISAASVALRKGLGVWDAVPVSYTHLFPQVMRVVSFLRWDSDQKMVRLFLPIARGFHV